MIKRILHRGETGFMLVEVTVALALLGTLAVVFLSGMATTTRAGVMADKHSTALSLARSQLDWVKSSPYADNATSYAAAPLLAGDDYDDYAVAITAAALNTPDDGIQKITVDVSYRGEAVMTLEGYKRD